MGGGGNESGVRGGKSKTVLDANTVLSRQPL